MRAEIATPAVAPSVWGLQRRQTPTLTTSAPAEQRPAISAFSIVPDSGCRGQTTRVCLVALTPTAARPSANARSGVTGSMFARPRIPSVPNKRAISSLSTIMGYNIGGKTSKPYEMLVLWTPSCEVEQSECLVATPCREANARSSPRPLSSEGYCRTVTVRLSRFGDELMNLVCAQLLLVD